MELYFTTNSDYHLVYNIGLFIHITRSKTLEFKSVNRSLPYVYALKVLFKVYKMGSNLKLYSNNYTNKMFEIIVDSESSVIVKNNGLFLFVQFAYLEMQSQVHKRCKYSSKIFGNYIKNVLHFCLVKLTFEICKPCSAKYCSNGKLRGRR